MKSSRRVLLKLACGALAGVGAGWHRAAAWAQKPTFRDADRTRDKIVALVRSFGSDDPKAMRHIQRIEPIAEVSIPGVKVAPDQLPLMDYFVGDLHLRYSFDDPRFVSSVSAADLKRLGLKRGELLALSVENFRRLYPGRKIEYPVPQVALVTDAGDLEPCLMLDAAFWEKESQRRGSAIVAAAPARDVLMFADRSVRGNVDILKQLAVDVYAGAGKEALSKSVFLWNQGRWEAFA
ncbi:MAG: hypothetical protein ACREVR_16295 [Burkholderiales bacterium]